MNREKLEITQHFLLVKVSGRFFTFSSYIQLKYTSAAFNFIGNNKAEQRAKQIYSKIFTPKRSFSHTLRQEPIPLSFTIPVEVFKVSLTCPCILLPKTKEDFLKLMHCPEAFPQILNVFMISSHSRGSALQKNRLSSAREGMISEGQRVKHASPLFFLDSHHDLEGLRVLPCIK